MADFLLWPPESAKKDMVTFDLVRARIVGLAKMKIVDTVKDPDVQASMMRRVPEIADALNAPLMAGLEAALLGAGVQVPQHDREPLRQAGERAKERALSGEDCDVASLVSLLGTEGYNAFAKEINK